MADDMILDEGPEAEVVVEDSVVEAVPAAPRPPRPAPRTGGYGGGGGGGGGYGGGFGGGGERGGPRRRQMGERTTTVKVCQFCVDQVKYIDYKKGSFLATYVAGNGKIFSRRRTGTCAKHQRRLVIAVKRARFLALLPYTSAHRNASNLGGE